MVLLLGRSQGKTRPLWGAGSHTQWATVGANFRAGPLPWPLNRLAVSPDRENAAPLWGSKPREVWRPWALFPGVIDGIFRDLYRDVLLGQYRLA